MVEEKSKSHHRHLGGKRGQATFLFLSLVLSRDRDLIFLSVLSVSLFLDVNCQQTRLRTSTRTG